MKKYSHEFFNQILCKLLDIDESKVASSKFHHLGDIGISVTIGDNQYWLEAKRDYFGVLTGIFYATIMSKKSGFEKDFVVEYILRGNRLYRVDIVSMSDEFKRNNTRYNVFYNPFKDRVVVEFDKPNKEEKRTVGLYVWWSFGKGDGDGRDSVMEVNEEQYKLLAGYNGKEIDEIDDPELKDFLARIYDEEIQALEDDTRDYWEPSEEGETFEDYWDNCSHGIRIGHVFEDDLF